MQVRLITNEEALQTYLCSVIAFHKKRSIEECKNALANDVIEEPDWACFDDDGKMMAHVINGRAMTRYDGNPVATGCIGGVSTFPEYRRRGAVREIFNVLLPSARETGEIFSTLYPFDHEFYRKFGYETCFNREHYKLDIDKLKSFRFEGWAKLWMPGDSREPYVKLYNEFASRYNESFERDDELMSDYIDDEPYATRRFTYLLGDEDGECAYVVFRDEGENSTGTLNVRDYAFAGKRGLYALLGFLARFTADYAKLEIDLPSDVDLFALIPESYDVQKTVLSDYMARVINVEKAIEMLKKPENAEFSIEVTDDIIAKNSGIWRVFSNKVIKTECAPDISVDIKALAPLLLGTYPLCTAELRNDVKIYSNRQILERIFVKKPIFCNNHF